MQNRLERLGIKFVAPDKGSLKDLENMNIEEKMAFLRKNRDWKCMVKWELLEEHEKTWKTNGLADLRYTVIKQTPLDEKNKSTKITVDVKLNGMSAQSSCDNIGKGMLWLLRSLILIVWTQIFYFTTCL